MGYCMYQSDTKFYIAAEDKAAALKALKSLHGKETCGSHFSWVKNDYHLHINLKDCLMDWRWEPELDDNGNITDLQFIGEKLGDDFLLFQTIAPYVKKDSFICMYGEDDYHWKWKFDGKTCKEIAAKVVWEDED